MKMQPSVGRILVGVDGSPAAAALRWAAAEARLRGMRLHVVHARDQDAVELAHYVAPGAGQGAAGHAADGFALKSLVRETVGPDRWSAVQFEVADGLPVRALLERAPGAAMLVLGSTRAAGLADAPVGNPRAPLGPVARDCLRAAPCPVVIVAEPGARPEAEPLHVG
jgi:nucleotide-binding universal stress UspA family protein